jgi:hypothetical protein
MHKIIAIVTAAACAAVIVGLIPEPEQAAAASTNAAANDSDTDTKASCFQNWPYYERSCLHDNRQQDGNARTVRVIAVNQQAAHRGIRQ